jgi:coatomer subunit beta'
MQAESSGSSVSPVFCLTAVSPLWSWAVALQSEQKWKQLAELATAKSQFGLAQECLHHAQDFGGLLLLATASGNSDMVGKLDKGAEEEGLTNVAFLTFVLQGKSVFE